MKNKPEKAGEKQEIERNDKGQFVPGVSGNPAGKPKGVKHLTSLLFDALQTKAKMKDGKTDTYENLLIQRILNDAIVKGNTTLINLIMNYIDGAPMQGIDLTTGGEKINASSDEVMAMAKEISDRLKAKKT